MEGRAVIATARAQRQKVVGRLRACLAEQLYLDVARGGFERHGHGARFAWRVWRGGVVDDGGPEYKLGNWGWD